MQMKFNYKIFIILLYSGFVALMVVLVYKCTNLKVDVIQKDYYAEELVYQQQIERQQRAKDLAVQPSWNLSGDNITFTFPTFENGKVVSGNAEFYCPSDDKKDKTFKIEVDNNSTFTIPKSSLSPGRYKLKLFWENDSSEYYNEGVVRIES
jgi:hypothetical protein